MPPKLRKLQGTESWVSWKKAVKEKFAQKTLGLAILTNASIRSTWAWDSGEQADWVNPLFLCFSELSRGMSLENPNTHPEVLEPPPPSKKALPGVSVYRVYKKRSPIFEFPTIFTPKNPSLTTQQGPTSELLKIIKSAVGIMAKIFNKAQRTTPLSEFHGRPRKSAFACGPVVGRTFLTPGHPGIRVRNVRGKPEQKVCVYVVFFPDTYVNDYDVKRTRDFDFTVSLEAYKLDWSLTLATCK